MTYISMFNIFALYFEERMRYYHYAFDYESVGSVLLGGPLHDSFLTVHNRLWRQHNDHNEQLMHQKRLRITLVYPYPE